MNPRNSWFVIFTVVIVSLLVAACGQSPGQVEQPAKPNQAVAQNPIVTHVSTQNAARPRSVLFFGQSLHNL